MGTHIGLLAAKTSVTRLRQAFMRVWTEHEVVATAESLADANAMLEWKERHEQFVSAADWRKDNPGREVYLFWQDGPWGVMLDESYVLASDEENLKKLSREVGLVISFVVESAGGCSFFWCYENGALRRSISNNDMEIRQQGEPLAEEEGIDIATYYIDEAEALLKRLGMSPFEAMPGSIDCQAICVIDRTEYQRIESKEVGGTTTEKEKGRAAVSPAAPKPRKPWWKFW